jgi:UDPglucose--hexose-1-phosphate uridylyltransferase
MQQGEIRLNSTTRQWVIFAPARGKRPHDFKRPGPQRRRLPDYDKECPFCPGNEHRLTSIIMETASRDSGSWQTRVVPNKFPALVAGAAPRRRLSGIYLSMNGYGRHEVIIESPLHNRQIAVMTGSEVEQVIETYHRRYLDLMRAHENMLTLIFRNHGPGAGTSLIHPHSQAIVTALVPQHLRWREEVGERYFDDWGRCLYCDILKYELEDGRRVLLENESFVAWIPFAAEVPFEIWIMPRAHQADFGMVSDLEKSGLAAALKAALTKLHRRLNDPDYNYVINTSPRYRADEPQLHWFLQIRPRLTTPAGFEIGSGIGINPSIPEEDAAFLREGG